MLAEGEYWVALRRDGEKGSGSPDDPLDASGPALFRDVMRMFDVKTTIHLGPGIFQTYGFVPGLEETLNWTPKSGQRIVGAGIHATTLKVVGASVTNQVTYAVGNDLNTGSALEGFEASDFTVDCNMRGHQGSMVHIAAVAARGNRVRLRRIRAVDFGTEHFSGNPNDPTEGRKECFVILTGGGKITRLEPFDCVVEDCILERPSPNDSYTTTGILLNSAEDNNRMGYHRSCVIRNCYIDYEFKDRPVAIASICASGTVAKAVTKTPHGRRVGEWVVVTGARVPSADNPFNGSYQITAVPDSHRFEYTVAFEPEESEPTGSMWIGKRPSHYVGIKRFPSGNDPYNPGEQGVSVSGSSPAWTVTVITENPHLRLPGENVALNGITKQNQPLSTLNRMFRISEVVNPTKLRFLVNSDPDVPDATFIATDVFIGKHFVGISPDGGTGARTEGNRVYGARSSIYHDTWSSRDVVIRRNHLSETSVGIYHNMGNISGGFDPQTGLPTIESNGVPTVDPVDSRVAILTTTQIHYWRVGDAILVDGVKDGVGQEIEAYNGVFPIVAVPDPKSIAYLTKSEDLLGEPMPATNAFWGALWQVGSIIAEGNIVELVRSLLASGYGPPIGMTLEGGDRVDPYVFRQVLVRANIIANMEGRLDPAKISRALFLRDVEAFIVSGNLVHLDTPIPIRHRGAGQFRYFNNQTPAGQLLQGIHHPSQGAQANENELTTIVQLAVLAAT